MAQVLVTEDYLEDIGDAIRTKNGTSTTYKPPQMAAAISALGIKKLYSGTVTVNTTSTSAATATTIQLGSAAYSDDHLLYVRIRDQAGKRAGYFYGSDAIIGNYVAGNGATSTTTLGACQIYRYTTASQFASTGYAMASAYGVYPYSLSSAGALIIRRRYNSNNSLTLNGTFLIEVYQIDEGAL